MKKGSGRAQEDTESEGQKLTFELPAMARVSGETLNISRKCREEKTTTLVPLKIHVNNML